MRAVDTSDTAASTDGGDEGTETGARAGVVAFGGILGAVAASSCCIVPLLLFGAGIGGAWIGNLTALAPYQPIFIATTLGFLAYGYYLVYRRPRKACTEAAYCAGPVSGRIVRASLWIATVLVAVASAFPFVAPHFLNYL